MNEAERLLEKLAGVPVIEPTAEEQKILDEYDADMAGGKASEYRSLDKISRKRIQRQAQRPYSQESAPRFIFRGETQGVSLNQYIAYVLASRKR